jgi:hypothetical protein
LIEEEFFTIHLLAPTTFILTFVSAVLSVFASKELFFQNFFLFLEWFFKLEFLGWINSKVDILIPFYLSLSYLNDYNLI